MGTTATQDDPAAAVAALKAQGAPDEAIHAYLTQRYGAPVDNGPDATVKGLHAAYQKGLLPGIEQGKNADEQSALPTKTGAVLETLETPLAGVPGGALAMSAARKLTSPSQSFASTQADVNRATSDVPYASALGRGIGGLASTALVPETSALKGGAILGAADQALHNDPNANPLYRPLRAVGGGLVGGAIGGATDALMTGTRALLAPNPSKAIIAAQDVRTAADRAPFGPSYVTAAEQAAKAKTSPELADAITHPGIAPYFNAVKNSELGQGMTDAEAAQETYRMMSELQGKKLTISGNGESTPASDFQVRNLGALKERLRNAIGTVAPDFPEAVATHAEGSQPITAMREGYNAAKQTLSGPVAGKSLGIAAKDPEAYIERTIPGYTPDQAAAATQGALGRVGKSMTLTPNPLKGFGVPRALGAPATATPLVSALDKQAGNVGPDYFRRLLLSAAQGEATP